MLETTDISQGNDDRSEGSAPGTVPYVGIAAKAIQIYETNARIAGGEPRYLGTSVSVVL
ncbi:MAG: hypothetical protein H8E39_08735 [Alphaproteobacteria bacterium]|nr:hypothetical protein [Alphaproteobacteria bacterium]